MSKATIIDNDLLKSEIRALYNYVNRDEYNLNVVEVMVNEIQDIVKGLKPCEKIDSPKECPQCHSTNIQALYGVACDDKNTIRCICEDCHKEFSV